MPNTIQIPGIEKVTEDLTNIPNPFETLEKMFEEPKEEPKTIKVIPKDLRNRVPYVREKQKTGRNELCYCGSQVKYKKCCYPK